MKKIINIFLILSFVSLSSCKTVQNKADEVIQKEDKYLMKFLNKKKDLLIAEFGYPDLTMPNDGEPPGSGKIIYIRSYLNHLSTCSPYVPFSCPTQVSTHYW